MAKPGGLKSQTDDKQKLLLFCLGLSTNLLIDMLQQAGLEYQRDVSTLRRRTLSEGLGFLTKTLPKMGKAIQHALLGNPLSIPQFRSMRGTVIPHFLKGLLSGVFNSEGEVRSDADVASITDLFQICFAFYKLEVPYDSQTEGKVLDKFAEVDAALPANYDHLGSADTRLEPIVLEVAGSLIREVLHNFDPQDISPRHGPGAVATGEKPHEKMHFKRIYETAERLYPATEYYFLGDRHLFDGWDDQYWSLQHVDEPEAEVMLVPKDSRGPRLISAEPLEIQFLQQGLGRKLVARIERHPLTRGHVNFRDQTVNRKLALEGSANGRWSTLDLSDASDRVSLALVERLFAGSGILPSLQALRSASTLLPGGREVRMRKYAPMGSALCFPVEALCFWALAVACIHVDQQVALKQATRKVYVYGDDIITEAGFEDSLFKYFPYFSLKLNRSKCCFSGSFRESCGCDAYRGQVVTPIKIKRLPLTRLKRKPLRRLSPNVRHQNRNKVKNKSSIPPIDGAAFTSWVSISNLLFQKGYYRAADYVKKHVESTLGEVLPLSMRDPHRGLNPWELQVDSSRRASDENLDAEPLVLSDSAPAWYVRIEPSHQDQMLEQLFPAGRFRSAGVLQLKDAPLEGDKVSSAVACQRPEYRVLVVRSVTYIKRKDRSDWRELYRHILADLGTKPYQYAYLRRVKLLRRWTSLAY